MMRSLTDFTVLELMSFRRRILLKALMLFDLLVLGLSFALAAIPVSRLTDVSFLSFLSMRIKVENMLVVLALMLAWHFILSMFGLYESKRLADKWSEAEDVLKAISLGTVVVILVALLFRIRMVTPDLHCCFLGTEQLHFYFVANSAALLSQAGPQPWPQSSPDADRWYKPASRPFCAIHRRDARTWLPAGWIRR